MNTMSALLGIIERETELVRAGKMHEAMALEPQKAELSRRYVPCGRATEGQPGISARNQRRNC